MKAFSVLLVLACLTACQANPVRLNKQVIVPTSLKSVYEELQYAPAVRVGDTLYLSGVVARMEEDDKGDISLAINRAFDEIEILLFESGASWADVVDVTSYMTDLDSQIGPLWAIKGQRVPPPFPAWTAIGVKNLYGGKAALMEIKVTAYLPS